MIKALVSLNCWKTTHLMSIMEVLEISSLGWNPTRTFTFTPGCRMVVMLCLCGFTPNEFSMCFL